MVACSGAFPAGGIGMLAGTLVLDLQLRLGCSSAGAGTDVAAGNFAWVDTLDRRIAQCVLLVPIGETARRIVTIARSCIYPGVIDVELKRFIETACISKDKKWVLKRRSEGTNNSSPK